MTDFVADANHSRLLLLQLQEEVERDAEHARLGLPPIDWSKEPLGYKRPSLPKETWKDTIQAALLIMALAVGGLVFLVLLVFAFMADFTIAPTTVIAFLLFLILVKMK